MFTLCRILGLEVELPAMPEFDLRFPGRQAGRFTSSKVNKAQVCQLYMRSENAQLCTFNQHDFPSQAAFTR